MSGAMDSVELSRGAVEYAWFGPPVSDAADPVIVLLHEGLGCVALWRDFPDRLSDATGLRVLAYSRYGYGGSAPCVLPRPISYMHDEALDVLPELLRALEIGPHLLVGHSDGGSIALINAGGAAEPGLRGVVTLAAHIFSEPVSIESIAKAKKGYELGRLKEALSRYHGANTDCAFLGWADAWLSGDFEDWNLEEYLPGIDVPCLVIQGEDDEYGTPAQVEGIAAGLTVRHETLMMPACGHSPHRDRTGETLSAIRRFADSLR
ncbi:MAG: alpha/beta fold hydrolase [Minwuia sp.]|uniref:alpha/beta fold hydrolase n=1 Tax=Minwuia sp. TaxID=2493630 RepID=UPI003A88B105